MMGTEVQEHLEGHLVSNITAQNPKTLSFYLAEYHSNSLLLNSQQTTSNPDFVLSLKPSLLRACQPKEKKHHAGPHRMTGSVAAILSVTSRDSL